MNHYPSDNRIPDDGKWEYAVKLRVMVAFPEILYFEI